MTPLESILEKLASEYTHGYGLTPMPGPIDAEVEWLVNALEAGEETGSPMGMNQTHGFVLLAYAERMASLAVREANGEILSKGMTALAIASRLVYIKEALPILSLMYNSAIKIGVDPTQLFSALALNESDELKPFVEYFPYRSVEDRSIQAMGYVEGEDEGGFLYVRTW